MGHSSVRGEGTRGGVPHAREAREPGWDEGSGGTGTGIADRPDDRDGTDTGTGTGTGSGAGDSGGRGRRRTAGGAAGRARGRRRAQSRKRKVFRWMASVLSLLILGTAAAGYFYIEHLNGNIRSGNRAGGDSGVKKAAPNALGNTPLNILLIGSDSRSDPKNVALGGGKDLRDQQPLADVQKLLHVSADRKHAAIVSIPRDTVVRIPECVGDDGTAYAPVADRPINETLGRGGPGCTLTTWETITGVYIDYWVMVDFAGVVAMADEVGGVPVCVKTGVWDRPTRQVKGGSGLKLPAGTHEIKGEQALQWLRTRHAFRNDQGRAKAQAMYMNGMIEKLQGQNAWTDTGRLMGLAETATKALQVSEEIDSVQGLFDLAMQLRDVKLDRLTTVTVPTVEWSGNRNKLVMVERADTIWSMLRDDVAFDKNGDPVGAGSTAAPSAPAKPKGPDAEAPGALAVTVVNGTDGKQEAAVPGRATALAEVLRGKGFTQASPSRGAEPRKDTVVKYPKADGDQGRANAASVAKALGLPGSAVRADAGAEGVTLVVGADWREGTAYEKPKAEAGDLPDGSDVLRGDQKDCMDVYEVYRWDGGS